MHFHLLPVIEASIKAGAHACFLSGAGPAVLALCSGRRGDVFTQTCDARHEQEVAKAMLKAGDDCDCPGKVLLIPFFQFSITLTDFLVLERQS